MLCENLSTHSATLEKEKRGQNNETRVLLLHYFVNVYLLILILLCRDIFLKFLVVVA